MNLFNQYRYGYRDATPFIFLMVVALVVGMVYVGFKYEDEQSQLMADCLGAHRKWVVVSSHTTFVTHKMGNTYYSQPQTYEEWGCVE